MPFLHDVDPARALAQARFRGLVTEDDLRCCLSRVWADPRWSDGFSALIDLSEASELQVSREFLRNFASVATAIRDDLSAPRTAVVAPGALLVGQRTTYEDVPGVFPPGFRFFPRRSLALAWVMGEEVGSGDDPKVGWAYSIRIHPSEPLLLLGFNGILRGSELRGLQQEVVTDPQWRSECHILADLSAVTSAELDVPDLIRVALEAEHGGRPPERGKLACLAPGDLSFTLLQRYRGLLLAFPREVKVLRTADGALEWLGLPAHLDAWMREEAKES